MVITNEQLEILGHLSDRGIITRYSITGHNWQNELRELVEMGFVTLIPGNWERYALTHEHKRPMDAHGNIMYRWRGK